MPTAGSRGWPTDGDEPDPRWTLANERTMLAYQRTALGLFVAGLAVVGSRALAGTPLWFAALGVPLIVLGAATSLEGRRRFLTVQQAMRRHEPLVGPPAAGFLPWGIGATAAVAVLVAVVELASRP